MAKPLNLKEHNQAFTKFLIFFFITLAMAVGAVYYNFQVPKKELAILRERSDILRNQQINQENYKRTLKDVLAVFNKLDSSSSKAMVESELRPKLDILRNSINIDDSTSSERLHAIIFSLVNKYSDARSRLFDVKGAEEEMRKKNQEILDLRGRLNDCQDRVNFSRQ